MRSPNDIRNCLDKVKGLNYHYLGYRGNGECGMAYAKELLKGNTDPLLLSLLNLRPMYGYEIIKEVAKRSEGYFKLNEGTLYPALHRLEKAGFIEGRWQASAAGQERRYYHITDKGRRTLQARRLEWRGFARAVDLIFGA